MRDQKTIDWLGEIPVHWGLAPSWSLYRRVKRTGHESEELLSVYRDHGVVPKSSRDDNHNVESEDLSGYQLVKVGDLVMNKMKAWQGSIALSEHQGIVSPAYFVFQPLHNGHLKYFHYLLRSQKYIGAYNRISKGVRVGQWDLDPVYFRTLPVPVPPLDEQKAIADFLDRELACIDLLLGKQKTLVETLQERNRTLILRAISGIHSTAQSENAGQWFGTIPDRWASGRLSRFAHVTLGKMVEKNSADTQRGELRPYLRAASVQPGGLLVTDEPNYMAFNNSEIGKLDLVSGDVVVVEGGAGFGRSAYLPAALEGWGFQNSINRVRCGPHLDGLFLHLVLLAASLSGVYSSIVNTATIPHLTAEKLNALQIPVPPVDIQREITSTVFPKLAGIQNLISASDALVLRLTERRQSLINAAVTGKIDVWRKS